MQLPNKGLQGFVLYPIGLYGIFVINIWPWLDTILILIHFSDSYIHVCSAIVRLVPLGGHYSTVLLEGYTSTDCSIRVYKYVSGIWMGTCLPTHDYYTACTSHYYTLALHI